jgi:hypothetical protein
VLSAPRAALVLAGLAVLLFISPAPAQNGSDPGDDIDFFDPVVTISPGISREAGFTLDSIKLPDGRFTQFSAKLQYPVLSWLQFILEVPVALSDPTGPAFDAGVGDLILAAQARVWLSLEHQAEVDLGLAMGLPSGSGSILLGSTSIQPFAVGGIKLGPVDVIGDLRYTWAVAGTAAGLQVFQANAAAGYTLAPLGRIVTGLTPFLEVNLLKPVRGADDLRPQLFVLPGLEVYLPWHLSISTGVQVPIIGPRLIDYRVLMFVKWEF